MATRWLNKAKVLARFRALPKAMQQNVRDALGKGAAELVALQKSFAPVDDGELQRGITWRWGNVSDAIAVAVVEASRLNQQGKEIAKFIEFGTRDTPASPFFHPAARIMRKRIRRRVRTAMGKALRESKGK